nr:della protein gaip [Quercus suber]
MSSPPPPPSPSLPPPPPKSSKMDMLIRMGIVDENEAMSTDFEVSEIDEGFDQRDLQPLPNSSVIGNSSTGKAKMCWEEEVQQDGGMDELLAVLGYRVRASDMAEVAQKLELLVDLMGNAQVIGYSPMPLLLPLLEDSNELPL